MPVTTRVFLVRHGETEWNAAHRFQGHRDIPLSAGGELQAERLSHRLARESLAAVYASDLSRAVATAQAIARPHGVPVVELRELREIDMGEWEGMSFEELQRTRSSDVSRWLEDTTNNPIPGGESYANLMDRVVPKVMELVSAHPDASICVVSHAGPVKMVLCDALGITPDSRHRIRLTNGSLSAVEYCPGKAPRVLLMNDSCHLRALT
ncbi:MAG: histidine phosphatase family protein [Firmicutes bacterium]|nr:histidine phosphatase family protein [Bacillota bacterium]MDH7496497.1 histidine phosphatase family protein [Bacillota bacterium]